MDPLVTLPYAVFSFIKGATALGTVAVLFDFFL